MSHLEVNSDATKYQNLITPYYESFKKQKSAIMALWLLKKEHQPHLLEFIENENLGHGFFNDRYIQLNSIFNNQDEYTLSLIKELITISPLNQKLESLHQNIIEQSQDEINNLVSILSQIHKNSLNSDQTLVLWLKPSSINSEATFELWLDSLLQVEFPENLKVAVDLVDNEQPLENLIAKYGSKIILLLPDDPNAYKEVVEDQYNPIIEFRNYFIKFGESVSHGDHNQAIEFGEMALGFAKQQNDWEQMEVGLLIAMAEVLIEHENQQTKAFKFLEEAKNTAQKSFEKELPTASVLLIQTLNAIGSAYIYLGDFKEAILQLESAIKSAENDVYCSYYLMEAQRLLALCHEHNKDFTKAWNFNEDALRTAENLQPEIRSNTTLPSIGEALFRLSTILKKEHEMERINQKMVEYVGEHWEELL